MHHSHWINSNEKKSDQSIGKDMEQLELSHRERSTISFSVTHLPRDPTIPLLDMYSNKSTCMKAYTSMFVAALFITEK